MLNGALALIQFFFMGLPLSIKKIRFDNDNNTRYQIELHETKTNWSLNYICSLKELLQLKERVDDLVSCVDLAELLNVSSEESKRIEDFYKVNEFCNICLFRSTHTCVPCVLTIESPIERELYLAFKRKKFFDFRMQVGINHKGEEIEIIGRSYNNSQNNFRDVLTIVDFYISSRNKKLCVYTDGHNYHERTVDQATRDRSIDRKLQDLGFGVKRFTTKEIKTNIDQIVKEILVWVDSHS